MSRFVEGENRHQSTLFPELLDNYISEDNSVRLVDFFVDELDLLGLGFNGVMPKATGRPSYHPSTLLKLYIYGYLNQVQSSRRLEREANRNVELMWLTSRLAPDFKTIADFRRDNGEAIKRVCREFVQLCGKLNLLNAKMVAIDGSHFKAVNHRERNFTKGKLKRRLENIETNLNRYFSQLDQFDTEEGVLDRGKVEDIHQNIAKLKKQIQATKELQSQVLRAPNQQISLTDPDARSMATSSRGSGSVGYNVQSAVDTEHHLIVEHEVTNLTTDRAQLFRMASKTRDTLKRQQLSVLADRGYYSGDEIKACMDSDIEVYVPKSKTSTNGSRGMFDRADFKYIEQRDEYVCPAGESLAYRTTMQNNGRPQRRYWSKNCGSCKLKSKCTTGKERRVSRWEHEKVIEEAESLLAKLPEAMLIRKQTVEHPFGTIKSWMGATHFQMRTLKNVGTEMSLHVLAYNMKRVINIMGLLPIIAAIKS